MIRQSKVTKIWITPQELREIAYILEQKWKNVKLGEEVPKYEIYDHNNEVHFIIDQEKM